MLLFLLLTGFPDFTIGEEEELPVLVRSFAAVKEPAPPFENGAFVPRKGETIAFLGGTDTFNQQRFGFLEEKFQIAWPDHELKIRNLGWQGDTIYHQARPRFFYTKVGDPQPGSSPDTRERTIPGIIFINFGKMESMEEEEESLPKFLAAYRDLLDQLETRTKRIVLVAPTPFFGKGPLGGSASALNEGFLARFVEGIRQLAEERGLLFADTFSPLLVEASVHDGRTSEVYSPRRAFDAEGLSANGIHLTENGQRRVAEILAEQLRFPARPGTAKSTVAADSLRQSIRRKNRLWQQYYHPTNWAFLFGDRQHVPASRDHEDTRKRWFLKEVDALPPLIAETEADIYRYAREAASRER